VFCDHILERNACDLNMSYKRGRGRTVHFETREVIVDFMQCIIFLESAFITGLMMAGV
jgi:hypothetical protein